MLETKEEIECWLNYYKIENYTINEDLTVDVQGTVDLSRKQLSEISVKFRNVSQSFYCNHNYNLESLEGCPDLVGQDFSCSNTRITTLLGGPKIVGRSFNCNNNQLTSLEYSPNIQTKKINGSFNCSTNKLTSLDGCPMEIKDNFLCMENLLENLNFLPKKVGGQFCCNFNSLLTELQDFTDLDELRIVNEKIELDKKLNSIKKDDTNKFKI